MEKTKNSIQETKTKVFNLIILDRSGSMQAIRNAAINGFNETLNGIKQAQKRFADTQEHYVSLVEFCNCGVTTVFDKLPACEARQLTLNDYVPCCCTPLYDAMGKSLTAMRRHVWNLDNTLVVVTVITDGFENSSCEYTGREISHMVDELSHEGWTFTYMGANQNAVEEAMKMSIHNARNFDYSDEGTLASMKKDMLTRMNFFDRIDKFKKEHREPLSNAEFSVCCATMADEAFQEEENRE